MTLIDTLITKSTLSPPHLIICGSAGVGKTTIAAKSGGIVLDCENGAGAVPGLTRTPYLQTWPEMRQWLVELATELPANCPAVAIDTLDWMIQRITEYVVIDLDDKAEGDITNTLGTAHGGYFKAREIVANIVYRDLLPMLGAISNQGAAIILLAHARNTKTTTPEGYDQQVAAPDLPHWIAPTFIEWADAVLYASMEDGGRVLTTESTNVVLAKNRYGLPATLPLSWNALMDAMAAARPSNVPVPSPMPDLRLADGDGDDASKQPTDTPDTQPQSA